MPLQIKRENIIRIKADAIVDPTDHSYSGRGGTDLQIHKAAGPELDAELSKLSPLETGKVHVTDSYDMMNCRYIFHTVGPVYEDGNHRESELLAECYRNSLSEAKKLNLTSIAFPLISSGTFGFPKGEALRVATDTITSFLIENEMNVTLLVFSKDAFNTAKKLYVDVQDYLCSEGVLEEFDELPRYYDKSFEIRANRMSFESEKESRCEADSYSNILKKMSFGTTLDSMPEFKPDESFSDNVRRLLKEKKLEDPQVYKNCNMDKKLFNHIKNDSKYRPKKETAVAIAIGFRLNLEETEELLSKAGYVLSDSFVFDQIIRYCIESKTYNIFDINEILFQYDQKTLGC